MSRKSSAASIASPSADPRLDSGAAPRPAASERAGPPGRSSSGARRARGLLAAAALGAASLAAAPAQANHFLLELEGGLTSPVGLDAQVDHGRAMTGTFGFGGRVPGQSPAYYLVGRVGQSEYTLTGPSSAGTPTLAREQREWAVAGRVYLPITDRFRAMLQLGVGQIYDTSTLHRAGHHQLALDADVWAGFALTGVQYRFTDHFSLGAVGDFAYVPSADSLDLAARSAGLEDAGVGRVRLGMTATFHF